MLAFPRVKKYFPKPLTISVAGYVVEPRIRDEVVHVGAQGTHEFIVVLDGQHRRQEWEALAHEEVAEVIPCTCQLYQHGSHLPTSGAPTNVRACSRSNASSGPPRGEWL